MCEVRTRKWYDYTKYCKFTINFQPNTKLSEINFLDTEWYNVNVQLSILII